jgi:hypothetical protein
MKLIIRLVGYSEAIDDEKYFYQINYDECVFNFDILKTKLSNLDIISNEELDNCTVTCNSKNLKKETIIDDTNTIYRLFIFSGNLEIKNKLIEIFKNNGEKSLMNQQIITDDNLSSGDDNISSRDDNLSLGDLDDNEPDKSSKESTESEDNQNYDFSDIELKLEIFKDPDFRNLIKIYKNKPEIFKDFYKYISTSYLVKLEVNEDIDYSSNLDTIKNMNLNFTDEDIIDSLKITNNHINLALRHLISTKS